MKDANDPSGEEERLRRLKEMFELFVNEHGYQLYRLAERYVGSDKAEDVVQKTMLRAWNTLKYFNAERISTLNLGGYLYRVLINLCKDQPGRRQFVLIPFDTDISADQKQQPEKVLEQKQNIEALMRAIDRLPEIYRKVIVLHYFEELKLDEIALRLNVSVNVIKSQHKRAKKLLARLYREELQDDEV